MKVDLKRLHYFSSDSLTSTTEVQKSRFLHVFQRHKCTRRLSFSAGHLNQGTVHWRQVPAPSYTFILMVQIYMISFGRDNFSILSNVMEKKCPQAATLLTGRKDETCGEVMSAPLTVGTKEM